MNLSIPFLFAKTIENVIRIRTVLTFFGKVVLKIWVFFAKDENIRGNNFQKMLIKKQIWEGRGLGITKIRVHTKVL